MPTDFEAVDRVVAFHADKGTKGLVVGGCTGESFTLAMAEQVELIRYTTTKCREYGLKVIAGTGSNNPTEAKILTQAAAAEKVDGVMLIEPYANKPTQEGLFEYYATLAKVVPDTPVMLYDVPGRTGVGLMPETVAALCKINNIVALKAANGNIDWVSDVLQRCGITVLSGDDSLTIPMMAAGASGVVSVSANIAPQKVAESVAAFLGGDLQRAMALHRQLFALHKALFTLSNPIPVKAALAWMGLIENLLRSPMVAMSDEAFDKLVLPVMQKLGILQIA